MSTLEKDREELQASLRQKVRDDHVKFYCSLLWFNKQSTELSESIRQVQEVAQHEIDDLMREKALNLQTIATLRKEIEALVSNQVSD